MNPRGMAAVALLVGSALGACSEGGSQEAVAPTPRVEPSAAASPAADSQEVTCADLLAAAPVAQTRQVGYVYLSLTLDDPAVPASNPEVLDRAVTYALSRCVIDGSPDGTPVRHVLELGRAEGVLP
jgi:hypothetical protein